MSIFGRFAPKETGKQKSGSCFYTPHREVSSAIEASLREAKDIYPEDTKTLERFASYLRSEYRIRYKAALEGAMEPVRAEEKFHLSDDRMVAYACLFQPENDGGGITLPEFMEDLHYEGINYGILQDEITRGFNRGYFHIFRVALGTPPKAGESGRVTEHFQRRENVRLEVQSASQVDFSQDMLLQPIRRGTVICSIEPPKPGTPGVDVTGESIHCAEASQLVVPKGNNTCISRDGQTLVASVDGLLYVEDGLFCIHEQKIIDGDLKDDCGGLEINGSLYAGGDVDGGVDIKASGDIVIVGKLGQGRVTSTGGTIRVQGGIFGTGGVTFLSAACQVQAPAVENAEINAGTSVIAESVLNSTIHCGGTVYAMTGRGIIANSRIWAGDSVMCQRVGNQAGGPSKISVGYPPHIPELFERIKAELAQVQSTIDMLWKPIIDLRNKSARISDGEKAVLNQLLVQRELYTKRREELMGELREVNKELDKKSKGRLRCDLIYPSLDVQIGRFSEKILNIEDNCNIHVEDSRLLMK